jgi:hypothetical protein
MTVVAAPEASLLWAMSIFRLLKAFSVDKQKAKLEKILFSMSAAELRHFFLIGGNGCRF